jgi:hypothetical protein
MNSELLRQAAAAIDLSHAQLGPLDCDTARSLVLDAFPYLKREHDTVDDLVDVLMELTS